MLRVTGQRSEATERKRRKRRMDGSYSHIIKLSQQQQLLSKQEDGDVTQSSCDSSSRSTNIEIYSLINQSYIYILNETNINGDLKHFNYGTIPYM